MATLPKVSPINSLEVEWWDTERPKDYPLNARKWKPEAVAKVADSITRYGWRQPIVVDKAGVIVIGHLRRAAARHAGLPQVPVHVAADLTSEAIRGLRLADNRTHEEAVWDTELLTREFGELKQLSFDLSTTGFSLREIDALTVAPKVGEDDVPEVPTEPITKPGDLWLLGEHRLLCGDATSEADVRRALGDTKPILLVTDPPYGVELDSEWRDRAGLNGCGPTEAIYMKRRTEGHTETTISGDTRSDWSEAFALVPSLQVAYVWHASVFTAEVLAGLLRIGFLYPQQLIWNKGRTVLTRTHYWYQHEPCWYMRKKNAPWYGKAGDNSTVWDSPSPKFIMGGSKEEKCDHPTQKPVELMRKSILNHIGPGEYVFDPFAGSGTTLIAAELTGRRCTTIELEPKYCDVIVRRWENVADRKAELCRT